MSEMSELAKRLREWADHPSIRFGAMEADLLAAAEDSERLDKLNGLDNCILVKYQSCGWQPATWAGLSGPPKSDVRQVIDSIKDGIKHE